jgi:hypothetical protein
MKKIARIVLAIVFVFGVILASAPLNALAKSDPKSTVTPNALIAGGSWTAGSTVDITILSTSAPSWLQLLSTDGIKLTAAGKVCHPLRGGQFGWVGYIMQYKDGEWVKIPTVNDWVPNKEGDYMACAQAPAAGTYALFGYYTRPAVSASVEEPGSSCSYSTSDWTADIFGENPYFLEAHLPNLPESTVVTFSFTYQNKLIGPASGSNSLANNGWVTFSESYIDDGWTSLEVEISALGCSKTIPLAAG